MPDLSLESGILNSGVQFVAGVDEAGRGPLAGPVVAAAVILPPDLTGDEPWLQSIDDSKKLTQAGGNTPPKWSVNTRWPSVLEWSAPRI